MRYLPDTATLQFFPEKCTGCRRCVEVCPHRVFAMDGKKAKVTDKDLCMECGACQKNCAFEAINVNTGVGCASAIIGGMISGKEATCGCSDDTSSCC